jgi:hypothetical protein
LVIPRASHLCEDLVEEFEKPMVENVGFPLNGRGAKRVTRIRKEKEVKVSVRRSFGIKKLNKKTMNGFIWNNDGFGDQGKYRTVIDDIR